MLLSRSKRDFESHNPYTIMSTSRRSNNLLTSNTLRVTEEKSKGMPTLSTQKQARYNLLYISNIIPTNRRDYPEGF